MSSHLSPPAPVELGPEELARLSGGSTNLREIPRAIICYWPTRDRPLVVRDPSPIPARHLRGAR